MLKDDYFLEEAKSVLKGNDALYTAATLKNYYTQGRNSVIGACLLKGGKAFADRIIAILDEVDAEDL